MIEGNPTREKPGKPSILQLARIPVWVLRAGLVFISGGLILHVLGSTRTLPAEADSVLQFEPVLLGLGIAFTVYGAGYHVAINVAHWRKIRENDHEGQLVLSGRKRFERRKKLDAGLPARGHESAKEEAGIFDALD